MIINNVSGQTISGLNIVQFETEFRDTLSYRSSVRAMDENLVQVTEVSDGGSVNHLIVENPSEHCVFFMDGDILAGAKQNRVLNLSILLAPRSRTMVPVSCVERGRWRAVSLHFSSTDHSAPTSLRTRKSSSLARKCGAPDACMADQAEVWQHVAAMKSSHEAESSTDNLSDVFAKKQAAFDLALQGLRPVVGANGLALFTGDRLVSLDVFNRADVLADYLPRLVRGALLDVAQTSSPPATPPVAILAGIIREHLDAPEVGMAPPRPTVGLGTERRYETAGVVAFVLEHESHPVHASILGKHRG